MGSAFYSRSTKGKGLVSKNSDEAKQFLKAHLLNYFYFTAVKHAYPTATPGCSIFPISDIIHLNNPVQCVTSLVSIVLELFLCLYSHIKELQWKRFSSLLQYQWEEVQVSDCRVNYFKFSSCWHWPKNLNEIINFTYMPAGYLALIEFIKCVDVCPHNLTWRLSQCFYSIETH